jgi:hypothetical protein
VWHVTEVAKDMQMKIKTGYLIFGVAQDLINRKLKNGFLTDQNLTKRKHTSFTAS